MWIAIVLFFRPVAAGLPAGFQDIAQDVAIDGKQFVQGRAFQSRQGQQVVDDVGQTAGLPGDDPQETIEVLGIVPGAFQQGLREALNGGHRCLQFMRDVGNELAAQIFQAVELGRHLVQRGGQLGDFPYLVIIGQLGGETPVRETLGAKTDLLQRRIDLAVYVGANTENDHEAVTAISSSSLLKSSLRSWLMEDSDRAVRTTQRVWPRSSGTAT